MYEARKIEDAVLVLPGTFELEIGRAWKRFDGSEMDALAEKGLISELRGASGSRAPHA